MIALIASCVLLGHGAYTLPDNTCTPGATIKPITTQQACTPRPRATIPKTLRVRIIRSYGLNPATFHGELDHRVPHFLNGADTTENLWPEPGAVPNKKDQLETYIYGRVCRTRTMRPVTAVRVFLGDWIAAYRRYIQDVEGAPV